MLAIHSLCLGVLLAAPARAAGPQWDLLVKGGHVIDPRNGIDAPRDVAIRAGKIARVAPNLPAAEAATVVDAHGLYVTPGLIDIHAHVYCGTGARALAGDNSVYPDGFSFRTGVTTMADAGTAGWRNFADFRERVISRARTRVLAWLNIVATGMSGGNENDPTAMQPEPTARAAKANADVVVGIKTAHYSGPGWFAVDGALEAGRLAGLPVMVDFGYVTKERTLAVLLERKLRPGDVYTHCYSGHRAELLDNKKLNPAMTNGRRRGVLFDVGHGAGSFYWNIAVPAFEQGFRPDIISTDLHTGSMNSGMKDVPNVMSKILNLGVPLAEVVRMTTWNAAGAIRRSDLGHLSEGAEADVTLLKLEKGNFGFLDAAGARMNGNQRLTPEVTIRRGAVAWDLNGRAARDWRTFPYVKRAAKP